MKNNQTQDLTEVLLPIPSRRGYSSYLVDIQNGRVWSKKSGRFLTTKANDNNYVYNTLIDDEGKRNSYGVHRLVVCAFYGDEENMPLEAFCRGKIEVDHIQEDKKYINSFDNLQMTDRKGQYKEETRSKMGKGRKMSESEVISILEELEKWKAEGNKKLSTFIHWASKQYSQSYRNMHNIVYKKSWKHLHEGVAV